MLSVAVWLGYSRTTPRADESVAPALHVAVFRRELGAELRQRPQVDVDRSGAEIVASGQRHPGEVVPGEQRPEDDDRGPHLLHELVGRHGGAAPPGW